MSDALRKFPKIGVSTDEQKQEDLDAYYKSVFDESDSEIVSFNTPSDSEWENPDGINFDEAEEEDWNG